VLFADDEDVRGAALKGLLERQFSSQPTVRDGHSSLWTAVMMACGSHIVAIKTSAIWDA